MSRESLLSGRRSDDREEFDSQIRKSLLRRQAVLLYWDFNKKQGEIELIFEHQNNVKLLIPDPAEFQAAVHILETHQSVMYRLDLNWIFTDRVEPGR